MKQKSKLVNNPVSHPAHYTSHPSGIEAIEICQWMSFCLGNVMKYIWRADLKHDAMEDLSKARWYLDREIWKRLSALKKKSPRKYEFYKKLLTSSFVNKKKTKRSKVNGDK
jgi:hypothetical protein